MAYGHEDREAYGEKSTYLSSEFETKCNEITKAGTQQARAALRSPRQRCTSSYTLQISQKAPKA